MSTGKTEKPKRLVTVSEIARLSGVSRSTVSAVLTGRRPVRARTRERVLECIRHHNYAQKTIARTMVAQLSRMVAVLAQDFGGPYLSAVLRGINESLMAQGYHVLFHSVRKEDEDDPDTLASLQEFRPAGYLILRGGEGRGGIHAQRIAEDGVPMVMVGAPSQFSTHAVGVDNRLALRQAVDYVVGRGHTRLGYLGGVNYSVGACERKIGLLEGLVYHNIPVTDVLFGQAGSDCESGLAAARIMLRDPKTRPTAVLCFNDMVAIGVYHAAYELGLTIPDDLSVVGFDGVDLGAVLCPPLTSVGTFPVQQGGRAANLLVTIIQNGQPAGRQLITEWVPSQLIERASVKSI